MMKLIKEKHPGVNIVAIDYDPGATKINQENRIKLMLSNAAQALREEEQAAFAAGENVRGAADGTAGGSVSAAQSGARAQNVPRDPTEPALRV